MGNTNDSCRLEKNEEWEKAWRVVNDTDTSLFLTGKAGTGKTTFLRCLKEHTDKRLVVLAPTGIAAINARGVTIHSFFQLPFSPFVPGMTTETQSRFRFGRDKLKIVRGIDLLVIDEISMVRADLLDAVDDALKRLRRNGRPFGGVQLLLIGDLQQLSPVVKESEWAMLGRHYPSPFFYDSLALKQTPYVTIELKKVFRQDDGSFVEILNKVRNNTIDASAMDRLNQRYIPGFVPPKGDGYIRLTTHNALAQDINSRELAALKGKSFTFDAKTEGNYPEYSYPTDRSLTLKPGAQVMFVKNDTSGNRQYYNGMIGEVTAINGNGFSVTSKDDGRVIDVAVETWQNCRYSVDEETKEIIEEVDGTFSQYPVKLAWAITIHKSQGLTFEHAIIDVHGAFAHGQAYVALSRCKTLDGLVLSSPITARSILCDKNVGEFTRNALMNEPGDNDIAMMRQRYILHLIENLFDFTPVMVAFDSMLRLLDEHLYRAYPKLLAEYKNEKGGFMKKVIEVSVRFRQQYERMAGSGTGGVDTPLQERITKGAAYFKDALEPLRLLFIRSNIATNNKQLKKQADNVSQNLREALKMKLRMLEFASVHPFTSTGYLKAKADAVLGRDENPAGGGRKQKAKGAAADGNLHPELTRELTAWRLEKVNEEGVPAYCVLTQKSLLAISDLMPGDIPSLLQMPGIGQAKADKYGVEILSLVKRYKKEHS